MRSPLIMIFLCISIAVNATTCFVGITGNNNADSKSSPYPTINSAWSLVSTVDISEVPGGTFTYPIIDETGLGTKSGTFENTSIHTYYVKNGGNDSNSGLDDANAWAHHPWMSTWTGSTVLTAGDIVYMKRGDTWSISNPSAPYLTVGQSGTSGNPITTTAYGTGAKPVIIISTNSNHSVIEGVSKSYITFDNLEISHYADVADVSETQCGIHITEIGGVTPHDWLITNSSIHNIPFIGVFSDVDSYNITVGDVTASSCATNILYSNKIYDCYYGAVVLYGLNPSTSRSDFNVYHNYIYNIGSGTFNKDAYGISFTEGVASSGWPAYCTARYNRIEKNLGWEGIETHGGNYIYFQDNYVYNCAVGIAAYAADRSGLKTAVLNHCYIERNIVEFSGAHPTEYFSGIIVAGENASLRPTNCYIEGNTIFYTSRPVETSGRGITVHTSDGVTVDGNIIYNGPSGNSLGAIRIGGDAAWKTKNITVSNNYITNWDAGIYNMSRSIDGTILIVGNIIKSHQRSLLLASGDFVGTINIYNNTFLGAYGAFDYVVGLNTGTTSIPAGSSLNFKNNILGFTPATISGTYIYSPSTIAGTFNCDYNLYWNSTNTNSFNKSATSYSFTNWKGLGYDTHSPNSTGSLDPLFVNTGGAYSLKSDFLLGVGSPAINKGTDTGVTLDYFGHSRIGNYDIGACEYGSSSPILVTSITVTGSGNATTITTNGGTLQMASAVLPLNAVNKSVTWSRINGTGTATINSTGLLTALTNGTVTVRATAQDGSAVYAELQITISNQVVLTNIAPTAVITSPAANSSFPASSNITITAEATDIDGSVSLVEFYYGSTKLGSKSAAPYSLTWTNVAAGTYSLTVVVTDNMNAKTTSAAISVSVVKSANKRPIVKINNPHKGTINENLSTVEINVVASDPDGAVEKVEIYNGLDRLVEFTSAPYDYTWKDVPAGSYSITAVATDNLNDTTISSPVVFIVGTDKRYDANSEIVNLYPNPNNGHFSIEFVNPLQSEKGEIVIADLSGKQVYHGVVLKEETLKKFDLSESKSGMYIMIIKDKGILVTKKFIKK